MRIESFAYDVSEARHKKKMGVREAARQATVSPATFSRVENRLGFDIETFEKLCAWAKLRPLKYLEVKP
jgi:transcriptional regulator with XRE-family HTH domain